MKQISFRAGQYIFKESDPGFCMYLIRAGKVSIQKSSESGPIEVSQVGVNQIIGELSFFDRQPRSADVVALSNVELVEIPFESLDPIFGSAPDYLRKIMTSLAERLRDADNTIAELKEQARLLSSSGSAKTNDKNASKEPSQLEKVLEMTKNKK